MNYSMMTDKEILIDLARKIEKIRVDSQIKETELEKSAGISRKTFYNFKQGSTGFSLRNFIRVLRSLGEIERLQLLFSGDDDYSPRAEPFKKDTPKRVRDKKAPDADFQWGDEA